ncbi:MAG: nucleoside triphosphate pyrophosphohydrolase [Clostridia bacterium]|nr:nucleoside triphosphate pyrophosphohydrolase [Clostridia bacterium]
MGKITVVGAGWTRGELTLNAIEALKHSDAIVLHTDRCGCADWLRQNGMPFTSLDALYETCDDFDIHAQAAADAVMAAGSAGDLAYVVSDIRDRSVSSLIERIGTAVQVIPGPPSEGALLALVRGEARLVAASEWEQFHPSARESCLVRELDSRELASEVKLRLMEAYPEELEVWLLQGESEPASMPLFTLDRGDRFDHRTCLLVPAQNSITELERYDFEHLNEIMRRLCAPDGCPWDRVQTHASLRTCLLEEAYEVIDAIDEGDVDHLYDELGDLLMLVALHAEIARRHGEFDISDVTTAVCQKLISRHTHIYGDDSAGNEAEVLRLWSRNKMTERSQQTRTEAMRSVTRSLPAMLRAIKVLKRSAELGLGEPDIEAACQRCEALIRQPWMQADAERHMGDIMMALAELARLGKVDPEIALNGAVSRFVDRFESVELEITRSGLPAEDLTEETLRNYWNSVKL